MKYVLIDWVKNGDMFTEEFETAEEAQLDCKQSMCSVPEYEYDDV